MLRLLLFLGFTLSSGAQAINVTCRPEPEGFFERWTGVNAGVGPYRTTRAAQDFIERFPRDYPLRVYELYRHVLPDRIVDTISRPEVQLASDHLGTAEGAIRYQISYKEADRDPFYKTCRNLSLVGRSPDGDFKDHGAQFTDGQLKNSYYYDWTLCLKNGAKSCVPLKFTTANAGGGKTNIKLALPWSHTLTQGSSNLHRTAAVCDAVVNRLSWKIYQVAEKAKQSAGADRVLQDTLSVVQNLAGYIDRFGRSYFSSSTTLDRGIALCHVKLNLLADKFFRDSKRSALIPMCSTADQSLNVALCLSKEMSNIQADLQAERDQIMSAIENTALLLGSAATLGTMVPALAAVGAGVSATSSGLSLMLGLGNGALDMQRGTERVYLQRFYTDQTALLSRVGWIDPSILKDEQDKLIEEEVDLINKKISLGFVAFDFADFTSNGVVSSAVANVTKPLTTKFFRWKPIRAVNVSLYQQLDRKLFSVSTNVVRKLRDRGKTKLANYLEDRAKHLAQSSSASGVVKEKAREQLNALLNDWANKGLIVVEKGVLTSSEITAVNNEVLGLVSQMNNGVICY